MCLCSSCFTCHHLRLHTLFKGVDASEPLCDAALDHLPVANPEEILNYCRNNLSCFRVQVLQYNAHSQSSYCLSRIEHPIYLRLGAGGTLGQALETASMVLSYNRPGITFGGKPCSKQYSCNIPTRASHKFTASLVDFCDDPC